MLSLPLISRLWQNARYRRLMRELLAGRPEAGLGLHERVGGPIAAAALGLLRLGELNRGHLPLARELHQRLLLSQNADGSWGEGHQRSILTALCIRGLSSVNPASTTLSTGGFRRTRLGMIQIGFDVAAGEGVAGAIRRGIEWLARAQQPDGSWGDSLATAFVLLELGRLREFREAVRVGAALRAGSGAAQGAPVECVLAWSRVELRCGRALRAAAVAERSRFKREPQPLFAQVA